MAKVEFKDFSLKFWGHNEDTLSNINLTFNTEEKILLLAPSGKGKSTLLMCLLGIIERNELGDTTGTITIDGKDISKLSPMEIAKVFGIVFQEPESQFCLLYPDEEVAFGLENFEVSQRDIEAGVKDALERVDIYHKKDCLLSAMSGGEQQRVAIASSIALESKMILLDEPTANLDSVGREDIMSLITSLDKGFLLVEHNVDEWIDFVDRVILLGDNGNIVADGKADDFFDKNLDLTKSLGIWEPENKWTDDSEIVRQLFDEKSLEVKNLSFSYGKKKILEDINFSVKKGEILAVLGKNGAGKSTLSKILAKLTDGFKGNIYYDNKEIGDIENKDFYRNTAYVFQNPEHQFIRESVEKEIELSLINYDNETNVESILKKYNLDNLQKENPFTLSGGEKRRLSVATMLTDTQRVLILDEPTFGLDYKNARELMEQINTLANKGMSVVIITHDMELVQRYAHRALVLEDGRKRYHGAPTDLWKDSDILRVNKLKVPKNLIKLEAADKRMVV